MLEIKIIYLVSKSLMMFIMKKIYFILLMKWKVRKKLEIYKYTT